MNACDIPKPANVDAVVANIKQTLPRTSVKPKGVSESPADMGLRNTVQVIWHGSRSGALIVSHDDQTGKMRFRQGVVANAKRGRDEREEALFAMLRFALEPLAPNFAALASRGHTSPESLLLEGRDAWTKAL